MPSRFSTAGLDHAIFDLAAHGLPELPLLGIHSQIKARRVLERHAHPGAMEIIYVVRGELVFQVGGRDHRMKGNEVFWTHPGEPHGSGRYPFGKSLAYWIQVRLPERPGKFLALSGEEAWPLVRELRALPLRQFPAQRPMKAVFEEAFRLAGQPAAPLTRLGLAVRIVEWLRLVVGSAQRHAEPPLSADIQAVLELIRSRPEEPLAVAELAGWAGLSESRFKAKFREQVGMPPAEYVLRRRIERAQELLRGGQDSITRISYRLGFSSTQYFATVFRRFLHRSPSEMRRRGDAGS